MSVNPVALIIRAKKIGVLIRDARAIAGKSVEECAEAVGVEAAQFSEWEFGTQSPSLPELEALAYYLKVPIEHFWGDRALSSGGGQKSRLNIAQATTLRQKIIGVLLRKTRMEAGLSLEEMAQRAWTSATLLEAYEMGEKAIPLPDLEVLTAVLDRSIREFQDRHGPVGAWNAQQRAIQDFLALSPELQSFVSKPVNQPYLELARRLSEMDADRLRSVAEGLLEITY